MAEPTGSIWDAIRSWADSAGLLRPEDEGTTGRPAVPEAVCAHCPICQGAATLDQIDTDALAEWADLARGVLSGMGSALASAAEQRIQGTIADADETDPLADSD